MCDPNNDDGSNTETDISSDDVVLVARLWSQMRVIDLTDIQRMRVYLESLEHHDSHSVPNE